MTPTQKSKRRQGGDSPLTYLEEPPALRMKSQSEVELDAWLNWEYPPELWDNLSSIALTDEALKEFDRRVSFAQRALGTLTLPTGLPTDLVRFARHGGPNLSHLRGYREPAAMRSLLATVNPPELSQSHPPISTNPPSTFPTSVDNTTKRLGPYVHDYNLHLTDHHIYATYSSKEPDLTDVKKALRTRRRSLSPSGFSDGAFKIFRERNARAKDEADVLFDVIPTILGASCTDNPSARNTAFGNLEPLLDEKMPPAKPHIYYGAHPEDLSPSIRNELGHRILPSTMYEKPAAPNFFMEIKGPYGAAGIALLQARHDGAVGSHAMHSLHNYGRNQPEYHHQPYTFSSIYSSGHLELYAHHTQAPTTDGGQPEHHMTHLMSYAMTGDRDTFIHGATALRNLRDLAKQYRDSLIQAANARTPENIKVQGSATAIHGVPSTDPLHKDDSSDESMGGTDCPLPHTPDKHVPGFTDMEGYSQDSALSVLGGATTRVTSSFTSGKRPRPPPSPNSETFDRSPPSKRRRPLRTNKRNQKSPVSPSHTC